MFVKWGFLVKCFIVSATVQKFSIPDYNELIKAPKQFGYLILKETETFSCPRFLATLYSNVFWQKPLSHSWIKLLGHTRGLALTAVWNVAFWDRRFCQTVRARPRVWPSNLIQLHHVTSHPVTWRHIKMWDNVFARIH